MLPTWFLSMWISNTATTSMMLPIVESVLIEIRHAGNTQTQGNNHVLHVIAKQLVSVLPKPITDSTS